MRGHKLADVHLQTLADGCQVGEVSFLEVLIESKATEVASIYSVHGLSKSKRHTVAGTAVVGIGCLVQYQFNHVQTKLVGSPIEKSERVGAGCRIVKVLTVVHVHKAANRSWPQ